MAGTCHGQHRTRGRQKKTDMRPDTHGVNSLRHDTMVMNMACMAGQYTQTPLATGATFRPFNLFFV